MMRPLAPFRAKPLRRACVRKACSAALVNKLAEDQPAPVKAMRRPIKARQARPAATLRVLGRERRLGG